MGYEFFVDLCFYILFVMSDFKVYLLCFFVYYVGIYLLESDVWMMLYGEVFM